MMAAPAIAAEKAAQNEREAEDGFGFHVKTSFPTHEPVGFVKL